MQVIALFDGIVSCRVGFIDEVVQGRNYFIIVDGKEHDDAVALFVRVPHPMPGCPEEAIGPSLHHVIEHHQQPAILSGHVVPFTVGGQ